MMILATHYLALGKHEISQTNISKYIDYGRTCIFKYNRRPMYPKQAVDQGTFFRFINSGSGREQ